MGVRGLTRYINSIGSLWTKTELRNTKLVIDGSGLCYCLYEDSGFDRQCGGRYEEFYDVVLSFFDALDTQDVVSFVVLDGAHDRSDKKLDTFKKRSTQRIQTGDALFNGRLTDGDVFVLPLLCNLVFVQALRDRRVKFAVADCEADAEVASLANAWNCPVLGNDSDFFIFDIKAGYIPLPSFDWKSSRLSAKIFHRRKLASHLRIRPELLPMFASLVGNDYVSSDALEPFTRALSRSQYSVDRSSRKEVRFAGIAKMLSTEPEMFSVLQMVSSCGGVQLRQAVEHSLKEYSVTESNLLRYFQNGVISSSLKTQNCCKIDEWVLRKFREGQFSTNCMSGFTSGKVLLRFQVENCREKSANFCSQKLRRFVYGILNDAEAYNGRRNEEMVEEWDREGLTVKLSNVTPYQEGVVRLSLIPFLDAEDRLKVLLNGLESNTLSIGLLPEKFKLIAASLRFLKSNAQPPLKTNHVTAILCSCIKLEDGSWKQHMKSRRMSLSHSFDRQAAQSFAQWQCVLRDAVHLNFVLLEPVETPCIHKAFNGRLAHCLQNELDRGSMVEELLRSSSNRSLYNEICNALEREGKNSIGLNTKYPGATRQYSYRTRDSYRPSTQSYAPLNSTSAVCSPTKRWEEHDQARQTNQVSTRQQQQQQQRVSSSQYNSSYKRQDRPIYHSPVSQGGASLGLPLSSSKGFYQRKHYAQPSVYSSDHHACKPQPVTSTSSRVGHGSGVPRRVAQRAYTEQTREDEMSARIQNLNLRANPSHSSKDFTAGENKHSQSVLLPREVSPPEWMSPSSKSASAASYNPVGYTNRNESKPPPNGARPPRAMSTATYPSASHYFQSCTPRRDKPVSVSPVRSAYGQRFFCDSSTPDDSPLPSDESWSVSDSPRSSDESWSDFYIDEAPPDFGDDYDW